MSERTERHDSDRVSNRAAHEGAEPHAGAQTKREAQDHEEHSNRQKDPHDWVTGDEPMTGAQASYLQTLSEEAGEEFNRELTKAQASERIEELQRTTGRGRPEGAQSKERGN